DVDTQVGKNPAISVGDEFVFGFECWFSSAEEVKDLSLVEMKDKLNEHKRLLAEAAQQRNPQLLAAMFISSLCRNDILLDELAAVMDKVDNIRRLLSLHQCSRGDCGVAKFLATLPKN
ncbi:MAG: hypothetical protein AAB393_10865, partial [Bacteroidota bacterium]